MTIYSIKYGNEIDINLQTQHKVSDEKPKSQYMPHSKSS